MLKSCKYCGRIHDRKYDCGKRPQRKRIVNDNEAGRYTTAWRKKSEDIKERSNYLCAVCQSINVLTYNQLEVHHIDKLTEHPERLLDDSNLICLCKDHHRDAEKGKIDKLLLFSLATKRDKTK